MAPIAGWGNNSKGCIVADREIPIWAFHGINDGTVTYDRGYAMFNAVDRCVSPDSQTERIFTTIQGGHNIWSDIYLPDNSIRTPNLYQWFLAQSLDGAGDPPANVNPTVDAGDSIETTTSATQLIITATANDPDGYIASYNWEKINGPAVTISNGDQADVTLTNLEEGEYNFRITVSDNDGATASDEVKVIVSDVVIESTNSITARSSNGGLDYLEYLPEQYGNGIEMPLIIYLHTSASEGFSPTVILNEGPMKYLNEGDVLSDTEPVIVVAPQIIPGNGFRKGEIQAFYDYIITEYDVDKNRIYIVGADEGATDLAFRLKDTGVTSDRWAAAALIGGNGPSSIGCDIGNTDVNLYLGHSLGDEKYSYNKAQSLYSSVESCNGSDMFFETLTGNHNGSIDNAFNPATSNLYSWLLSHDLGGDSTITTPTGGITEKISSNGQAYLEYLPEGFDPAKTYPALVYLHSQMAEGTDLDLIRNEGPFYFLDNGENLCVDGECYLIFAPQVLPGNGFKKGELLNFYNYLIDEYNLDLDRMYIVGADEGASDLTYRLTDTNGLPEKWAAAAFISGNGPASFGCDVGNNNINIYSAHSIQDEKYDYTKSQNLYNAIDGCSDATMLFETLSGNHNTSISNAFDPNTSNLYAWLLDKTLNSDTPPPPPSQEPGVVSEKISRHGQPYLEYLPPGFDPSVSYPVLVYFHSEAAEGNDLNLIKNEGPFYFIENGENLCVDGECFIILAPQIELGSGFWKGKTDKFYSHINSEYNVDPDRIYLAGFDDGANNALSRMADNTNSPNRWAAVAGVGFKINESQACGIAGSGTNFYLAHGMSDEIDPFSLAQSFGNALDQCTTSEVLFNALPGNHQQSWEQTFDPQTTNLYAWLLGKRLLSATTSSNGRQASMSIDSSVEDLVLPERPEEKNYRTNEGTLDITSLQNQPGRIRILSTDGRVVLDENILGVVDVSRLRTALYVYQVTDQNGMPIQRGRILKF